MQALTTKVEFFAELPEPLYQKFRQFINDHPDCDQNTALECAIALYLAMVGDEPCEEPPARKSWLTALLGWWK